VVNSPERPISITVHHITATTATSISLQSISSLETWIFRVTFVTETLINTLPLILGFYVNSMSP